jgi:CDP-diacylglycerol---glycerol-3-phosphate 3-phosphatidyltransferase
MTPNQLTAVRVGVAFAAVALFSCFENSAADLAAVALTIAAIALDGLDGYLARTRGMASPLGAQVDILGDRIVENLFFTFFAVRGLVSIWVPVIFFVRGALTDFSRALALRAGRVGFARNSMLESRWVQKLVASRESRGAYAVLKCVCFCYLGLLMLLSHSKIFAPPAEGVAWPWLVGASQLLVAATVAFCLVRAVPVIWEGHRYWQAELAETPAAPPAIAVHLAAASEPRR